MYYLSKYCLSCALLVCFVLQLNAQTTASPNIRCGTDAYHASMMQNDAEYRQRYRDFRQQMEVIQNSRIACDGTNMTVVPLAFHFFPNTGLTCDDQACLLAEIQDQIDVMNVAFGDNTGVGRGAAFSTNAANCESAYLNGGGNSVVSTGSCISFCLASPPACNADGLVDRNG